MRYITESEVLKNLTMPDAIALVERAFRQFAEGLAINHPRRRISLPSGATLHYMAGADPDYFGVKVYSTHPATGAHFEVLLYKSADGLPLATFEANHLGQIRTGAASAVGTKYLARPDAAILAVIGSGFQAETQVRAISHVRTLSEIRVWSRSPEKRADFARRMNAIATETAREAVEGADIIVTATSAKDPVLETEWISPGAHINAMGSNRPNRRELPGDLVLHRADLVAADSVEDAQIESGDLIIPGALSRTVEFADIVAGRVPGRTSPGQITVFKSNGLAIQDIAVAAWLYNALQNPDTVFPR
jgi:ornithine cyclodeaminase/alanine dehydrogenase-like protein (mu-crystallin family)